MKEVKENKKVLYFAVVNELLIIKNRHISPTHWLMQARNEMLPPNDRGYWRAGSCLLQAAMTTHEAHNAGPHSEL